MKLDHSVYPDLENPPLDLPTIEERADYLHRVCASWDFGVAPERYTIELLSGWKEVFDEFPVSNSPGYHAFRAAFGWEPVPRSTYFGEWDWTLLDKQEGRTDPCLHMV